MYVVVVVPFIFRILVQYETFLLGHKDLYVCCFGSIHFFLTFRSFYFYFFLSTLILCSLSKYQNFPESFSQIENLLYEIQLFSSLDPELGNPPINYIYSVLVSSCYIVKVCTSFHCKSYKIFF